jgi:large conductance mechanosensitive channel
MVKGFRDFIFRGNVINMAVAVIIGVAFTRVITAITDGIVRPIVSIFGGAGDLGLGFRLVSSKPATFIAFGPIISAIVDFLIIAAVLYFALIVPMKHVLGARFAETETTEGLLGEIRDLIRDGSADLPGRSAAPTAGSGVEEERRWFDNAARQGRSHVDETYDPR